MAGKVGFEGEGEGGTFDPKSWAVRAAVEDDEEEEGEERAEVRFEINASNARLRTVSARAMI